ncbi:MAG: DUF2339 domain-containing protein [Planctomycetota bacterium]|nr:DUF2339 domain-containing protein [Planctomycetota bacterium]
MAGTVEERLDLIEHRLFVLERHVRALRMAREPAEAPRPESEGLRPLPPKRAPAKPQPAARELPHAKPTIPRPTTPVPTRKEPAPPVDWERFFGMAVLGRVGVAAVLLAAAYFAKLAYVQMSDTLRVLSIYALAGLFVGVGFALRSRVAKTYVALLWGGGTAAAYLAGVAARLRYELVDALPALALLLGASALGQWLARRVRLQAFASVALAGAFAAPLLIASPTEDRTGLMIYLLALHGWSAWIQRVWGWTSARLVGVAGTLLVGGIWLVQHGGMDTSTYVHVQLYLLGLIAPEIVRVARGIRVDVDTTWLIAGGLGLAQGWMLMEAAMRVHDVRVHDVVRGPLLVCVLAAALLVALSIALARRAPLARNRHLPRALARVGWVALAIGAWLTVKTLPADLFMRREVLSVLLLGAIGVGALALRRQLGVGETGALAASILATLVAMGERVASDAFALLPAALIAPTAILLTGRRPWIRAGAAWAGLISVLYVLAEGSEWHTDWVAGAAAGGALWLSGVFAVSRKRADHALARNAVVGMGLVTLVWMGKAAWFGRPHWSYPDLLNGVTAAALLIAGAAGFAATHLRTAGKRGTTSLPTLLWIVTGLVLLMAGGRATALATQGLMNPAKDAWMLLYLASAGATCAAVGRWRGQPVVVRAGLGIVLAAGLLAFQRQLRDVTTAWFLLSLLAPTAGVAACAWLAHKTDRWVAWGATLGLGIMAAVWSAYVYLERLPVEHAVINLRFLGGVAILGAGYLVHRSRAVAGLRRDIGRVLVLAGAAFGFVVGLLEVWEAVRDLKYAWPDVLVSVYATLYAAGLLVLGFYRQDTRFRYSALVLFGGVVLKVGLHDLATADRPLRILVTGVLGLVLLAAAFAYARKKEDHVPTQRVREASSA